MIIMFKGCQLPLYQAAHSKIEKWTKMKNNGESSFLIHFQFWFYSFMDMVSLIRLMNIIVYWFQLREHFFWINIPISISTKYILFLYFKLSVWLEIASQLYCRNNNTIDWIVSCCYIILFRSFILYCSLRIFNRIYTGSQERISYFEWEL